MTKCEILMGIFFGFVVGIAVSSGSTLGAVFALLRPTYGSIAILLLALVIVCFYFTGVERKRSKTLE